MRETPRRAAPPTCGSLSPTILARALVSCLSLSLGAIGACSRAPNPADAHVRAIDLLHESGRASRLPDTSIFSLGEHTVGGETRRALAGSAPCRIIWTLRFPRRSLLRTMVAVVPARDQQPGSPPRVLGAVGWRPGSPPRVLGAVGVEATIAFRIGVSDERLYDALAERRVTVAAGQEPQWLPVNVDLSLYAGRQWSLFFRPDSHPWRLVFNADRMEGQAVALWGSPGVDTDVKGAREWRQKAERRAQP